MAIKEIEKEFNAQIASAKAEMQKLFKADPAKAPASQGGDKENHNMTASKVEGADMSQSQVRDHSRLEKSAVQDTPAKKDTEFDEFESAAKGKTDAKSKLED